MSRNWLVIAAVGAVLTLLAYAWIDGGLKPLRPISQTVVLTGAPQ